MKILDNSIFFLIVVSETFAYRDKTGNHGKIQFSKLASFGRLWGSLAAHHLLTRYVSCFKDTGWWLCQSYHLSIARRESP